MLALIDLLKMTTISLDGHPTAKPIQYDPSRQPETPSAPPPPLFLPSASNGPPEGLVTKK